MYEVIDENTVKEVITFKNGKFERIYKLNEMKAELDRLESEIAEKEKKIENIHELDIPEDYKNMIIEKLEAELSQIQNEYDEKKIKYLELKGVVNGSNE